MKKLKVILTILSLLASAAVSHASSASVPASMNYFTPVSVSSQSGFSFSIVRKTGLSHFNTALYASDASWPSRYDTSPYASQIPGCFKVSGEPAQNVLVHVNMPATLTAGALVMNLDTTGSSKMEGAFDPTDCATAIAGTYAQNKIDGTVAIPIPAGGNLYYAFRMNTLTQIKINSDSQGAYTGDGTVDVDYQLL